MKVIAAEVVHFVPHEAALVGVVHFVPHEAALVEVVHPEKENKYVILWDNRCANLTLHRQVYCVFLCL